MTDIVADLYKLMCSKTGCMDLRISMTAKLAIYEIEKLRKELTDRIHMCDMRSEKILELTKDLDKVRALYCEKLSPADPQKVAEKWRWDCFDNGKNAWLLPEKCKDCMDKLAELDEELGLNE
jgi:superfamily II helicase